MAQDVSEISSRAWNGNSLLGRASVAVGVAAVGVDGDSDGLGGEGKLNDWHGGPDKAKVESTLTVNMVVSRGIN